MKTINIEKNICISNYHIKHTLFPGTELISKCDNEKYLITYTGELFYLLSDKFGKIKNYIFSTYDLKSDFYLCEISKEKIFEVGDYFKYLNNGNSPPYGFLDSPYGSVFFESINYIFNQEIADFINKQVDEFEFIPKEKVEIFKIGDKIKLFDSSALSTVDGRKEYVNDVNDVFLVIDDDIKIIYYPPFSNTFYPYCQNIKIKSLRTKKEYYTFSLFCKRTD